MKLLITGSRKATPRLLKRAHDAVAYAKSQVGEVIVGDAEGVDAAVIQACDELQVPVTVYGAYGRLRRTTNTGRNFPLLVKSYRIRDDVMAKECTHCFALCHNKSKGTMHTYSRAKVMGKTVWIEED
jgi:hypothetical protein